MTEDEKQIYYRDARHKDYYGDIWTSTGKCVFCDLRDKYIVMEEDGVVLTTSLFAYIDGDMMIIPKRHVESASEFTSQEWEAVRKLMHVSRKIIRKVYGIRAINFVQRHGGIAAQSTVPHFHIKIIPFDAPDLAQWNYRKLSYTPLENAQLVKAKRKFIIEQSVKYDQKYADAQEPTYGELTIQCKQGVIKDSNGSFPILEFEPGSSKSDQMQSYATEILGEKSAKPALVDTVSKEIVVAKTEEHLRANYRSKVHRLVAVYELNVESCDSLGEGWSLNE